MTCTGLVSTDWNHGMIHYKLSVQGGTTTAEVYKFPKSLNSPLLGISMFTYTGNGCIQVCTCILCIIVCRQHQLWCKFSGDTNRRVNPVHISTNCTRPLGCLHAPEHEVVLVRELLMCICAGYETLQTTHKTHVHDSCVPTVTGLALHWRNGTLNRNTLQ